MQNNSSSKGIKKMKLDALIKKFSNDMELGYEVRKLSLEKQNSNEPFTLEKKDISIVFKALHLLYSSMYEENDDNFRYVMTLLKKMKEHCYWTEEDEKSLWRHNGSTEENSGYHIADTNCIEGSNCD